MYVSAGGIVCDKVARDGWSGFGVRCFGWLAVACLFSHDRILCDFMTTLLFWDVTSLMLVTRLNGKEYLTSEKKSDKQAKKKKKGQTRKIT